MPKLEIDLSGDKLLPHQRKLINSKARMSALICGRGAGKSYACAVLVLLTLLEGKNVIVGGTRYDTIHDTLFEELKRMANEFGLYQYIQWRERPMMMTFGKAHCWFLSYDAIESGRGYSRVSLLVLDEGFLAPANILSVWGPCQRDTGGRTRVVMATTPRAGSLWNIMMTDPDCKWEIIQAVSRDNPHISEAEYELILAGITSQEQYDQEILGKISTGLGGAAIIHLEDFPDVPGLCTDERVIAGLDCAEGVERDATAFVKRKGDKVLEMWKLNEIDHEETVRRIRESNKRLHIDKLNMDAAFSDYEFTTLRYEINCEQIRFGRGPSEENKEKYGNVRAEMFFNAAYAVKHGLCAEGFELTPELKRQLCSITWHHDPQGRLLLVKKEELRAALKMSPDVADAFALTCLERYHGDDPKINTAAARVAREVKKKRAQYAYMMQDI